ncbi:TrkH family potassium uptake protein [Mesoaciditoga sp.]
MKKAWAFFSKISPEYLLLLTFAALIFTGTLLLMLPFSTTHGIKPVDALFTSTSAACVTGLIVVDTPHAFTLFGQLVILILIQIGGLGIMTLTTFFAMLSGRRITLRNRILVANTLNVDRYGGILRLITLVIKYTFMIESTGAMIMFFRFYQDFPNKPWYALWQSIFHSVSAFCNAGFSLFSNNLEGFTSDPLINITIMALIVLGGIGFAVIWEIEIVKFKWSRMSLNTKLVLSTTFFLIVSGFLILLALNYAYLKKRMGFGEISWISIFQAVTPRTAGFDTYPISHLSTPAQLVIIMLMFIGGSPGSTAGGIKTTTFAAILLKTVGFFRGKDEMTFLGKNISHASFRKSVAVLSLSLLAVFTGIFLLGVTDPFLPFKDEVFEVFSAFGTVGLDLGISSVLSFWGKIVVVLLMYAGRMGIVTIVAAFIKKRNILYNYPSEDVIIG